MQLYKKRIIITFPSFVHPSSIVRSSFVHPIPESWAYSVDKLYKNCICNYSSNKIMSDFSESRRLCGCNIENNFYLGAAEKL